MPIQSLRSGQNHAANWERTIKIGWTPSRLSFRKLNRSKETVLLHRKSSPTYEIAVCEIGSINLNNNNKALKRPQEKKESHRCVHTTMIPKMWSRWIRNTWPWLRAERNSSLEKLIVLNLGTVTTTLSSAGPQSSRDKTEDWRRQISTDRRLKKTDINRNPPEA